MPRYHVKLQVTDSANPGAHTYVSVPVEQGEYLSDAEIESRALARAAELFDGGASGWTLLESTRKRT